MNLLSQIEANSKNKFEAEQLICISMLVFYCGIRRGEIPKLQVKDLIDKACQVTLTINRFTKPIKLNSETSEAIQSYYNDLKARNPTLARRRSPLFPSFQDERKLHRRWKNHHTKYIDILHDGIKHYYRQCLGAGVNRKKAILKGEIQFRISAREFEAVVSNKKIGAGASADTKLRNMFLEFSEKADRLHETDPAAQSKAEIIITEFDKAAKKIKKLKPNQKYLDLRNLLLDQLSPYIKKQNS